ncbi:MAG TPA: hypothetical protein VF733_02850 [Candidatus Saccharimonadales bacterium]
MKIDYATPEAVLEQAAVLSGPVSLENTPREQSNRDRHYADMTDTEFLQLKHDRSLGFGIVEVVKSVATDEDLLMSVAAIRDWLSTREDRIHNYSKTTPLDCRIPGRDIRWALLGKILDLRIIDSLDRMDAVAESLLPLVFPQNNTKTSKYMADGFPKSTEHRLTRMDELEGSRAYDEVALYAMLTDRGIYDEKMWGKVGIQRFNETTPLAVTIETHRRFVMEGRDVYAPITERAHLNTLTKYCYEVIEQVALDPKRNQNIKGIRSALRMSKKDNVTMRLNPIIRLANMITASANKIGGIPDVDGKPQICQGLPERSQPIVGEAMRRILYATRTTEDPAHAQRQEYQDSLFTEIIHEIALIGADVQAMSQERAVELHHS